MDSRTTQHTTTDAHTTHDRAANPWTRRVLREKIKHKNFVLVFFVTDILLWLSQLIVECDRKRARKIRSVWYCLKL
jgi:hypothetical protein